MWGKEYSGPWRSRGDTHPSTRDLAPVCIAELYHIAAEDDAKCINKGMCIVVMEGTAFFGMEAGPIVASAGSFLVFVYIKTASVVKTMAFGGKDRFENMDLRTKKF